MVSAPDPVRLQAVPPEREVITMISFSELLLFASVIISVISLVYKITKDFYNKK